MDALCEIRRPWILHQVAGSGKYQNLTDLPDTPIKVGEVGRTDASIFFSLKFYLLAGWSYGLQPDRHGISMA